MSSMKTIFFVQNLFDEIELWNVTLKILKERKRNFFSLEL